MAEHLREHLAERIDNAGHPVYRLGSFERIATLMDERAGPAEIRRVLAEDGAGATAEPYAVALLAVWERIAVALERIADHLDRQREEG